MKLNFKARDWHNWISVILIIPMLLVGFTSVFLAHKKELGLNDIDLTPFVGWLPGYGASAMKYMSPEITSTLTLSDEATLIGTKHGLFKLTAEGPRAIPELGGDHIRAIVSSDFGIVVAAKGGIWLQRNGDWERVIEGEGWHASLEPDGSVTAVLKDTGPVNSTDGMNWYVPSYQTELTRLPLWELPPERVTLGKLMIDVHTGRAFLGKSGEWIWIDVLAVVLLFLGFTGIWLWWRTQTKRRDAAVKRLNALSPAASR